MNRNTAKLFRVLFQEAQVVDFDFSEWDRRLRLVVSGGLVGENFQGRGPLHNVDFAEVSEILWRANHLGTVLDDSDKHFQWVIMEFDVQEQDGYDVISLGGIGPAPTLQVTCRDVNISELDASVIDRLNPEWNQPYLPLARPGFERLLKLRQPRPPTRT